MQALLSINAGSSSLKLALYAFSDRALLAKGLADEIGPNGRLTLKNSQGAELPVVQADLTTHEGALSAAFEALRMDFPDLSLRGIGHRVVHGGAEFSQPCFVTPDVLTKLSTFSAFAPLHQPHNLNGIKAAMAAFPDVPQVACFDTAFHRSQAWVQQTFGLPQSYYDGGLRRYGFHGLSYDYVLSALSEQAPPLAGGRLVIAHLGNGASMCAVKEGRSFATTMGFSALDGLPMGTRCGAIDPGVLLYLMDQGMGVGALTDLLYKKSGLLGLSGISNDMRTLEDSPDPKATQAITYFIARCQREIGGLAAVMGGLDALVFTGGIGEHAVDIRGKICAPLEFLGLAIDPALNETGLGDISSPDAQARVWVIPTDEERVIAEQTGALLS